jgi:tungstate transport system ATP-binding protein
MSTLLEVSNLEKRFGDRLLFSFERLVIEAGQVYILTGPNGAGKSTLLRILAGLEPAEAEEMHYQGHPIALYPYSPELRRTIVYVHQHPVMFDRSLAANVGYGLAGSGLSRQERDERVEEAIAWAGITHWHDRPAATLSGGEKQRVALARARVLRPALLLLDEPTSSLDGAAREQVLQLIPRLRDDGCGLIITSHERDMMNLSDATRISLAEQRLTLQCATEAVMA